MRCLHALTVFGALSMGVAADDDPPYLCNSDAYCAKKYPGTACIAVNNYGDIVSKCTPNTAKRPACRGGTPGLCPSYQSPDIGYLNAHCIFVSEENLVSSSGSGGSGSNEKPKSKSKSSRRQLLNMAEDSTSSAAGNVSTVSATSSESSKTSGSDDSTAVAGGDDKMFSATINGKKVSGQFVCLDVSDCINKAADPTTCEPTTCQSPNSKEVCSFHGTCTYKSKLKTSKRSCMCYAGFEGNKCEKEVSNACDVDCGTGGNCVAGKCVCKAGFDGKAHDGKKGKPNQRCTLCTNDLACQHDNTCNIDTGKCLCGPGYNGDTCGATEDSCTTRTDCGIGSCQVLNNGSSACYCPSCNPTCELCDITGNSSFDCSTCSTSGAAILQPSKLLALASIFSAVMIANFAL